MTDLSSLPLRQNLRGLSPYGAPQLDVPYMLNTNENTHPVPEEVATAIAERVAAVAGGLNRYPDREFTGLRRALAGYLGHGLTADHVWCTSMCVSPVARTVRSIWECRDSAVSMWS